jgi:hypothetical protein
VNGSGTAPGDPGPATPGDWRAYLHDYGDLYLRTANEYQLPSITEEQHSTRWMGREPATEEALTAAEHRLGLRLPPSLRAFFLTSDGWLGVGGWVERIHSCAELRPLRDTDHGAHLIELYGEAAEEYPEPVRLFENALEIAVGEDLWLLDPTKAGPNGEWPAHLFEVKYGEFEEFTDFTALMDDSRTTMEGRLDP